MYHRVYEYIRTIKMRAKERKTIVNIPLQVILTAYRTNKNLQHTVDGYHTSPSVRIESQNSRIIKIKSNL